MNILFLHQAFPAQFGRLGLELSRRYGWRCQFLIEHYSSCPTPTREMLEAVEIHKLPTVPKPDGGTPWPQVYGRWLEHCQAARAGVESILQSGPPPDLIVAHGGQGAPTAFLPEVVSCPVVNYCEYYFPNRFADLTYRVDLPTAGEVAPFYPRCINAPTLVGLLSCSAGYSPTHYQRRSFPERFQKKIEVHFDGVDTELYRPRPDRERLREIAGRSIGAETRIVTFVARGLESMRGFDLFLDVAKRILKRRRDVLFVVAGSEETYYGWDNHHTGGPSFKTWAMDRLGLKADLDRFVFLGQVLPEQLAEILATTNLHLYLSVPFVPSWSLFNALASGALVLAGDTEPVREIIEPGRTGLLTPLFDTEAAAEIALQVLEDPGALTSISRDARSMIEERYGLDVAVPQFRDYFERVASLRSWNS